MIRPLLTACALALVVPAPGVAGRIAVGAAPGVDLRRLAERLDRLPATTVSTEPALRAIVVDSPRPLVLEKIEGVAWTETLDRPRRLAFVPTDPLAVNQWYLARTRAFDHWAELPPLPPVRVAVIDSGIDAGHPDLDGRVLAARSFVDGSPRQDDLGHGTFVGGIIAASVGNGTGIAGMAFPGQLLVAKVVTRDGTVPVEAEARAIRWAVDAGARVLNLSLGGLRDPVNLARDTYSPLEAAAVAYARSKGAVVVAAVGNATDAPREPWPYANYPAALPHVLGVSALARDGSVPLFSDRDALLNDLAAPGEEIYSTLPLALTASRPACPNQGYSDCGPRAFQRAKGTSFAAPQAAAAAALLLASAPGLASDQVTALLTRSARDAEPATGCGACPTGRDSLTGWGLLDVTAALEAAEAGAAPPPDALEPNDDAGAGARTLWGARQALAATLDFWDDASDVYRVRLRAGERMSATLRGPRGATLALWKPGTSRIGASARRARLLAARSEPRGPVQSLAYRVPARAAGWYFLQARLARSGAGPYVLAYSKR